MSWGYWLKKLQGALNVISRVTDLLIEISNSSVGEHHTHASLGVARKHAMGLAKGLGHDIPVVETHNVSEVLRVIHHVEMSWSTQVVGQFLLFSDYLGASEWKVPDSLRDNIATVFKQFDHTELSRGVSSPIDRRLSRMLDKIDNLIDLVTDIGEPPKACGDDCTHSSSLQCCRSSISGTDKIMGIRMFGLLKDDFNAIEIKCLESLIEEALLLMSTTCFGPVDMVSKGHVLGTTEHRSFLSYMSLVNLVDNGMPIQHIIGHLNMLSAVILLIPYTRGRLCESFRDDDNRPPEYSQIT
ncbi:TPA_asm: protein 5 [Aconitum virus 1]|uniref:Protein 5 n=1 Tax=Aconitum virus 1 TaxID=2977949 RepID=A0A9N6YJ76_9RHAB|nr:TPA_asm: protein 5 [Aconitum virus 1]